LLLGLRLCVRILKLLVSLLSRGLLVYRLLIGILNKLLLGRLLKLVLEIHGLIVRLCNSVSLGRLIAKRDIVWRDTIDVRIALRRIH